MPKTIEAGIHPDVPMEDYIADPCPEPSISKGVINTLVTRSPAHAHLDHPRLGGFDDDHSTRADLGSAAHAMLLGGAERIAFIVADNYKTKAAQNSRDAARADGRIPMLAHTAAALDAMATIARKALEPFGPGDCEHTLAWEEDGTWFRCRPDWLSEDRRTVIDYKTASNADPNEWIKKSCMNGAYDLQAALNLRGLDVLIGSDDPRPLPHEDREFLFLVQEITPPYCCSIVGAGPLMLELARKKIEAGIRIWRRCMSEDRWPGYDSRIHWAEPPTWATFDWENRDAAYHSDRSA